MTTFTERVLIEVQARTQGAVKAFGDMRTSISEAHGIGEKAKASLAGLGDVIGAAGPTAIVGGALAAGKAVLGLMQGFQDAALSADKLSKATGLTVQQASKWQEVAGDLGVDVDALGSAMGKMVVVAGKTPEVFERLGVPIRRTADGAMDVNETFLTVIDTLRHIEDPARRAAVATELVGKKGLAALAPMLDTSEDLRDALDKVSKAKIIDPSEVEKAKKLRDTMDQLSDTLDDVKLTAGSLAIDSFGPLLHDMAELVKVGDDLVNVFPGISGGLGKIASIASHAAEGPLYAIVKAKDAWSDFTDTLSDSTEEVSQWSDEARVAQEMNRRLADEAILTERATEEQAKTSRIAEEMLRRESASAALAQRKLDELADQQKITADRAKEHSDRLRVLNALLDDETNAVLGAFGAQKEYNEALARVKTVNKDAEASTEDKTAAIVAAAVALADYKKAQAEANGTTQTATDRNEVLRAEMNRLSRDAIPAVTNEVNDLVNQLEKVQSKNVNVRVNYQLSQNGRPISGPPNTMIPFAAPPAAVAAPVTNVNVTMPAGVNGTEVVRRITEWEHRNGQRRRRQW